MSLRKADELKEPRRASPLCPVIRDTLKGGVGGVFEVCGEAGSGKTQWALGCLAAAVEGRGIYICTEGRAPTRRLAEILRESGESEEIGLERVLVREVGSVAELKQVVLRELPRVMRSVPVELVVIDSIAAVFRPEFVDNTLSNLRERSNLFSSLSAQLHLLSDLFDCPILVVNQVSAGREGNIPALGLAWSNCLNARLMLSHCGVDGTRALRVVFCPRLPELELTYRVRITGICACSHCK